MDKYPKAFEKYFNNLRSEGLPGIEGWLWWRFKHACYKAWMAGRRYEKQREGR